MMILKTGVRIQGIRPETVLAILVAERIWAEHGAKEFVLTSCVEGRHAKGSLHPAGGAFDCRTKNIAPAELDGAISALRTALGSDFDIVLEERGKPNEHVHVEYQPGLLQTLG